MKSYILSLLILALTPVIAMSHPPSNAQYIANEGVLIVQGETKIMFDPLPLSGLGTYMDISEAQKTGMMMGQAPYNGIDAVFISHAHRDHFSATDMIAYMVAQPEVQLIAPEQAVAMMRADAGWHDTLIARIQALNMGYFDGPKTFSIDNIEISSVRIPHSGWPDPQRAAVQNMVYRVTLGDGATVMHMGDADVRREHYTRYSTHWADRRTDMAFPPYWFFLYADGPDILDNVLNIESAVGTHVPLEVPTDLKASGADYFIKRGEVREITPIVGTKSQYGCREDKVDINTYSVCTFHPMKHDIRFFHKSASGKIYGGFDAINADLATRGKTLSFGMNGGMFHSDYSPVGLYIKNYNKLSPLNTQDGEGNFFMKPNGVFWIWAEDGLRGAHIATTQDFDKKAARDVIKYATQSGPMLVYNGVIHTSFKQGSKSRRIRNGVGITERGEVVFVKSETPVNFHTFATYFRNHVKASNALYLDGIISRLYDASSLRNDQGAKLGPVIGVVETR